MKKTFEFNGQKAEAFWNEKDYRGVRYVNVKFQGGNAKGTDMTYVVGQGWTKNGGYNWASKVAEVLGF